MASLRCPICDRPFDPEESPATPFCSDRCRWIDLQHWLQEDYGLAEQPEDEAEDAADGQ